MRASATTNSLNGSATVNLAPPSLVITPESVLTVVDGLSPPMSASTTDSSTSSLGVGSPQASYRPVDGLSSTMTGQEYIERKNASSIPLQDSLVEGSEYRISCVRLMLGLRYYSDDRGMINRHTWNEMPSTARAVIASGRLLNQLNDDLNYKRLLPDRKRDLRNQLKGILVINPLITEVLFVNSDLNWPKFFEEWPLDKMLIIATGSQRSTMNNKAAELAKIECSIVEKREASGGQPSWLGEEQKLIKKIAATPQGGPSLNGYPSYDDE